MTKDSDNSDHSGSSGKDSGYEYIFYIKGALTSATTKKIATMYIDYVDLVLRFYEMKKDKPGFSQRLSNPSRRALLDECVAVFDSRFDKKDLVTLQTFFGPYEGRQLRQAMLDLPIDRLRPLMSFMNREIASTNQKNIELLAWLIDLPPRPLNRQFNYEGYKIPEDDSNSVTSPVEGERSGPGNEPVAGGAQPGPLNPPVGTPPASINFGIGNKNIWLAASIIVAGLGYWGYYLSTPGSKGIAEKSTSECMVWRGEKYEAIACDSLPDRSVKLRLDTIVLNNFRRITRPDTIMAKHLSKIWYQKRGHDSLDYFTMGERDPIKPDRFLKPMSRYIFKNYLQVKPNATIQNADRVR